MMLSRRLARSLVAGTICGTVVVLLVLLLMQLHNLYPHTDLSIPLLVLTFFQPMFAPVNSTNLLVPFVLWFIVGFGVGIATRTSRTTLLVCIGLFVLYVLGSIAFLLSLILIL